MTTQDITAEDAPEPTAWFDAEARAKLRLRAENARRVVETFVENNPLVAVGAAAAAGFLIARMLRR